VVRLKLSRELCSLLRCQLCKGFVGGFDEVVLRELSDHLCIGSLHFLVIRLIVLSAGELGDEPLDHGGCASEVRMRTHPSAPRRG
jgi:hypothetical protein